MCGTLQQVVCAWPPVPEPLHCNIYWQTWPHSKPCIPFQVQAFYQQMGSVMAQRCDELGSSKASSRQPDNSKLASPTSAPMPIVMPAQGAQRQQQQTCKIEEVT